MNEIFESITNGLVILAKYGSDEEIKEINEFMNKKFEKMNEVLDSAWFNRELTKLWRESHKEKSETKN